ncbi:VapC toxin family PIN domain ribonuclease [Cnuibacter sp. UC19_7]|uniref:VapC toxin family PIN domain ribonuclease n=1 Tax=Cnuibacter sp. UC19_7 TaxID=3350166 RepID=UPI00366ABED7
MDPLLGNAGNVTAVTVGEILLGVAKMPRGTRREVLGSRYARMLSTYFSGCVLPFDWAASIEYADIVATRRGGGRPISQSDAEIAAIVRSREGVLWTRNVRDFEGCGIEVVNPWE